MSATQDSLRRLNASLDSLPGRLTSRMHREMKGWGERWERGVRGRFGGGGPLTNRSGFLQSSIKHDVPAASTLSGLRLRCYTSGVVYARIQEFGGVIRPRNAKFLTIPTAANLTAAGVPRYPSAREFIASHPGETYFVRLDSGELLLIWKKPSLAARKRVIDGKLRVAVPPRVGIALWRLVRQVELPGPAAPTKRAPSRLGFFDTWKDMAPVRRASIASVAADVAESFGRGV